MTNSDNERELDESDAVAAETSPPEAPVDDETLLAANLAGQLDFGDRVIQELSEMDVEAPSQDAPIREKTDDGLGEHLDEIADDMLVLIRRVRTIEQTQESVLSRMDQLNDGWSQAARTIAREVDTLRRDVVGERSHAAATGVFNELIPMIENLRTMRCQLDEEEDARMIPQLDGVLATLSSCLGRLGCREFDAEIGGPFDASRMECKERQAEGEPGVVLESVRPGYTFGDFVQRRVLVKVEGAPNPMNHENGDSHDE